MDQQDQEQNVITIVLAANNRLGYTIPGQPARRHEELRQHLRHAFQQATHFAIGQGVDLFIQAGDLFDTTHPDEQDRSFVAECLAELKQSGIRTFALGGMHDTPVEAYTHPGDTGPAPQLSFARLGALHYFPPMAAHNGPETLQPVLVDIRGTLVGLCGFSASAGQSGDPLAQVRIDGEIERAAIPLLLLSTPLQQEAATSPVSALSTLLAQTPFRAVLGGYAHVYQHFTVGQTDIIIAGSMQPFDVLPAASLPITPAGTNSSRLPESIEVAGIDSTGQDAAADVGFVFLGITSDGVRWCRHITVDSIHLHRLEISLAEWWTEAIETTETTDSIEPTARLLEELRPLCTKDAMVQLRLTGEISRLRYHQLELSSIQRYGEAHAFAFSIDDSALTFLPGDEALPHPSHANDFGERLSPREELISLADEWIAAAQDEQERKALLATKEELLAALWSVS